MEAEVREEEEVSCPRDFLQRFAGGSRLEEYPERSTTGETSGAGGGDDDMELSLGLSLGGVFGSDKKLVRSSSVAAFTSQMIPREQEFMQVRSGLTRACSLPTQAEEERRKRKELQSLKRLEAKRKRLEKRSFRLSSSDEAAAATCGGGRIRGGAAVFGSTRGVATAAGLPRWASPMASRSTGSPGSSSSSKSTEQESRPVQGLEFSESSKRRLDFGKSIDCSRDEKDTSAVKSEGPREGEKLTTDDMPCVSTTGDGPEGRRIEGFLYRYRKGEDVRIVCVCHGKFLTPAEFVKHAGGGDVEHPLRHIVVIPSPSTLS